MGRSTKGNGGDGDGGMMEAFLSFLFALWQWGLTFTLRGGVPGCSLGGINYEDGEWKDLGDALAMPCGGGSLLIPPSIDPEGRYNVDLADLVNPAPVPNIDAENEDAANADLNLVLLLGQVVGLPQQMERDEANRTQDLSSVAEMGVAPPNLASNGVAVVDTLVPEIDAAVEAVMPPADANYGIGLPKCTEVAAEAEVDIEVDGDTFLLISAVARLGLRFASASMTAAGDLEANLEELMPLDYPEAGNSPAEVQAEVNIQNDVENVEVEEPHANGLQ